MALKYPAIPAPTEHSASLLSSVAALKDAFEILASQRKGKLHAAVTWQDLVKLGLIAANQVPT